MKKLLIVVDMQNDFITGPLGTADAVEILPRVRKKIEAYRRESSDVIFTRDTHGADYLETQEGRRLPVVHCVAGTYGHKIESSLDTGGCAVLDKPTFGSLELAEQVVANGYDEIELCGLCTDICVVSNALILKARLPEATVRVDPLLCAGVTRESHEAALLTMRMGQVEVGG